MTYPREPGGLAANAGADAVSEHTQDMEREHIRSQLLKGRSPADLHDLLDSEVTRMIHSLRDAQIRARRFEAERDLLVELVNVAVEHLLPLGAHGGANQVVQRLKRILESLGLTKVPRRGFIGTETTRPAGPADLARVKLALRFAPGGRQLISLEPPAWLCTIPPGITLIEYLGVEYVGADAPHEHDWDTERETDVTYTPPADFGRPKVIRACCYMVGPVGDRQHCRALLIDGVVYEPVRR